MNEYLKNIESAVDFKQNQPIQKIIYNGLRTCIMQGKIPFGVRLNEMQISNHLNISRTPIREAIRQLQYEGFLELIPNYGTVIKQITESDVIEVYQLRVALETLAFTAAMNNMSESDLDFLDDLLIKTDKSRKLQKYDEVVQYSKEFNDYILYHAKMPRLKELLTNLQDYLHRFRTIAMKSEERCEMAIKEHQEIVKAMREKDKQQINMVIEKHVNYSKNAILMHMRNELD